MIYRTTVAVPVAFVASGNAFAAQLGIDEDAEHNTLRVPIVPLAGDDDAEPTHYGCSGIITAEQRAALEAGSGNFPGASWWRTQRGEVLISFDGQHLGETMTFDELLASVGLKRQRLPNQLGF